RQAHESSWFAPSPRARPRRAPAASVLLRCRPPASHQTTAPGLLVSFPLHPPRVRAILTPWISRRVQFDFQFEGFASSVRPSSESILQSTPRALDRGTWPTIVEARSHIESCQCDSTCPCPTSDCHPKSPASAAACLSRQACPSESASPA